MANSMAGEKGKAEWNEEGRKMKEREGRRRSKRIEGERRGEKWVSCDFI